MTRHRPGLIRSRLDHARRHADRSDTNRGVSQSGREGPCKRISGALTGSAPGGDLSSGEALVAAAEIVGESHATGLSVVWTVLCDHRRGPQTR